MAGAATGVNVPLKVQAQAKTKPLGTARNAIFIQLTGAMSQMDCWDFKETKDTPKDLNMQKVSSDVYLSKTLFPRMVEACSLPLRGCLIACTLSALPNQTRQDGRFCREFGSNGPAHPRLTLSTRIRPGPGLPNKRFQRGREIGPTHS